MTRTIAVYISLEEAASLLSVSPRTIRRYVTAGHLDAGTLPGGPIRVRRAQVLGCIRPLPKKDTP